MFGHVHTAENLRDLQCDKGDIPFVKSRRMIGGLSLCEPIKGRHEDQTVMCESVLRSMEWSVDMAACDGCLCFEKHARESGRPR